MTPSGSPSVWANLSQPCFGTYRGPSPSPSIIARRIRFHSQALTQEAAALLIKQPGIPPQLFAPPATCHSRRRFHMPSLLQDRTLREYALTNRPRHAYSFRNSVPVLST